LSAQRVAFAFAAMCPPPLKLTHSIQITEKIQFLDEERGRAARRNSICFFFAMWYLASRNELALDRTVYSRLQKSLRFREVTIRDNLASEVE
jgi:hypothetical protein